MDFVRGQVVRSKAGRDSGLYLVILADTGDRVLVANGRERRLSAPKLKNRAHLAPTNVVLPIEKLGSDEMLMAAIEEAFGPQPVNKGGKS